MSVRRSSPRLLSTLTTVTTVIVVAATLATVAITSTGYQSQKLELDDGTVWVANNSLQLLGRANSAIGQLDTVVEANGSDLSVVQSAGRVFSVDASTGTLGILDPATATITATVTLPARAPQVVLAAGTVSVIEGGTGRVWMVPEGAAETFDAGSEPTLTVGSGTTGVATVDGDLLLYSEAENAVSVVRAGETAIAETIPVPGAGANASLSATGENWVLLDRDSGVLRSRFGETDLAARLTPSEVATAVLQSPGAGDESILVAFTGGVLEVSLPDRNGVVTTVDGARGNPAVPSSVDGCVFSAWPSGVVWRRCASDDPVTLDLAGMSTDVPRLGFAVNTTRLVLNDSEHGTTWAVQSRGEPIDNWTDLVAVDPGLQEVDQASSDAPPELDRDQKPPVALDDSFGARAGRATTLPVLLNDFDPNGDPLTISAAGLSGSSSPGVIVSVTSDLQQLRLELPAGVTGPVRIDYTISDGLGGSASAAAEITVRQAGDNGAPRQMRQSAALVAAGETVETEVLGDWVDPDGDVIFLSGASAVAPDSVTHSSSGSVTFTDGRASARRSVALVVSDGIATGTGSLDVAVYPHGGVPIFVDAFVVTAFVGQSVEVSPLFHVRGGNGALRLASVPEQAGIDIVQADGENTFSLTSTLLGTHFVQFLITDGITSVTGRVRLDVSPAPDAGSAPITTPKTVFVHRLDSDILDATVGDIDPAGGVLVVTSAESASPDVAAQVLGYRDVKVTLRAPLPAPIDVSYTITNGLSSSTGTITVIELPSAATLQPPIAADDSVSVRPGGQIDIPVLSNDRQPDGEKLTLSPRLAQDVGKDSGLLFVSGSTLRYLAPATTGNFYAVYEVAGPDGQVDQARVSIAVREALDSTNRAPLPKTILARATAGASVTIPVPLTGIDPDGDPVQLLGVQSSPQRGSVVSVSSDSLEYRADEYSAGTDEFEYSVIDSLGVRSTGIVRVGISPRLSGSRSPVAVADSVIVRPGRSIGVQVLANDFDPDGGSLEVTAVQANEEQANGGTASATISGAVIRITPPRTPGRYGFVYSIANERGGTASSFVTVIVDPDAPPAFPLARDTVLTLSDTLGRQTVTVDVLRNVFFSGGAVSDLAVGIAAGFDTTARIVQGTAISVRVTPTRQVIPFSVADPDDPRAVSWAFLWVPGSDDALPQLDRSAATVTVASESTVTIDLRGVVIAAGGKHVRLAGASTVTATHANGDPLVLDDHTIRYTSADGYFGTASVTFTVTDGTSAEGSSGDGTNAPASGVKSATLVLPITVTPRENQPPLFSGGAITFEPGESKQLDLMKLTVYPYSQDLNELRFSALSPAPAGFEFTLTGSVLTLTARASAVKGTTGTLAIGVRDAVSAGRPGTLTLAVIASTRPLAVAVSDRAIARRGQATSVDVLANDSATNPFPDRPLVVRAIRGLDGDSLPTGVAVTASADRRTLQITVSPDAAPTDSVLEYQLADATGDPDRFVWGLVLVSVQDRPDAPVAPSRADGNWSEGLLTLKLTAPAANNSPVTGYEVVSTAGGGYRHSCGVQLRCMLPDLTPGIRYQFAVIATNAVGASDRGALSTPLAADFLPEAPDLVTAAQVRSANPASVAVRIQWAAVPDPPRGTPVSGYTVLVTGSGVRFSAAVGAATTVLQTTADGRLEAGARYSATVFATNDSAVADDADWRRTESAVITIAGPPLPVPVGAQSTGDDGNVTISFPASDANGGTTMRYSLGRFDASSALPQQCLAGEIHPGVSDGQPEPAVSGWTDRATSDGERYRYVLFAENEFYCTISVSAVVQSLKAPGQAIGDTSREPRDGQFDLRVASLAVASGTAEKFEARIGQGAWFEVGVGSWLTSPADGSVYGLPQAVQYRGCRTAETAVCGPPSAPVSLVPIDARGRILTCSIGTVPVAIPPQTQNASALVYRYAYYSGGGWTEFSELGVAPPPDPLGTGKVMVRLRMSVTVGDDTVTDAGYDEATCSP